MRRRTIDLGGRAAPGLVVWEGGGCCERFFFFECAMVMGGEAGSEWFCGLARDAVPVVSISMLSNTGVRM